ncbi:uncharacterized protein ATC70_005826 [Mucor velutinosus]|uniref:Uncharacterized protein n=1 Tax=Mucor velutinosus TaxID=708070 RepID=A0AAN7DDG6_9FUNG|nr:hypothetical protein ATC70_005826 [Mucor velutinosus]
MDTINQLLGHVQMTGSKSTGDIKGKAYGKTGRIEANNTCVFKKQKLSPSTPTTTHVMHHHHSTVEWSFHPTDTSSCGSAATSQTAGDSLVASSIANDDTSIAFFDYNFVFTTTPELDAYPIEQESEHGNVPLPTGWTLAGRKRSIFELDTNIHTLSELYSTLVDLRNQLPDPVADQVESLYKKKPSLLSTRSSTDYYMSLVSRSGSSNLSSPPGTLLHQTSSMETTDCEQQEQHTSNDYDRLHWIYPDFIFELLVHVYLDCICFTRVQPNKLLKQHRQGDKLNRAYACAIYAYAALHALLCHPEKFGIYPFMHQLAENAYQIAFDLVEFDAMDSVTCETLVIMYQYLLTMGQDGEARNLFCLAQRQMELLLTAQKQHQQDVYRMYAWMAELDWSFALAKFTAPLIEYRQLKMSLDQIKPVMANYTDEQLYIKATKFRIRGLHILLSSQHEQQPFSSSPHTTPPHRQLNQWRTKYLETFLYKRHAHGEEDDHQTTLYTLEDKLALRLHALYFAGMLELHQQHMLKGFEADHRWEPSKELWPDYFSSFGLSFEISTEQRQVEKGLYRSMNAAYGFIQVIRLLLDEGDRCILPQVIDTLSAACTVLYFGNKVVFSDKEMIQKSQEALSFVVHAFLTSTTFAMMECPRIDQFVKKWGALIS